MAKAGAIINGVIRMVDLSIEVNYDETLVVSEGGYSANDVITLPASGNYNSLDLMVFLNGQFLEPGADFDYEGVAPRTQIRLLREDLIEGDRLRLRVLGDPLLIYDETVVVPEGGFDAGTNITLPNSKTYADVELMVYLDGQLLEPLFDYNFVGTIPRTQIQLAAELFENERLRFRIDP